MTEPAASAPGQLRLWGPSEKRYTNELCRDARRRAGWSQMALARAVGMTQPSLSRSEAGTRAFSVDELVAIASVLDVSVMDLSGRSRAELRRRPAKGSRSVAAASIALADLLDGDGARRFASLGGSLRAIRRVRSGQPLTPEQACLVAEAMGRDLNAVVRKAERRPAK